MSLDFGMLLMVVFDLQVHSKSRRHADSLHNHFRHALDADV